jgi:2-iminobutanoate/2-iminopropanoate deaminase
MRQKIHTDKAPAAIGPYSQAIRTEHVVYTAGQVGADPQSGKLVEGGIAEQTQRALQNLSAILEAAGSSLRHVVKTTVFLTDLANFAAMNEVYKEHMGAEEPPARSTVQVSALPLGALVEIECVALLEETPGSGR